MKKVPVVFVALCFLVAGCAQEQTNTINNDPSESNTVTTSKIHTLELKTAEELELFKKVVNDSPQEPGIVNMTDPLYQFHIDDNSYYLWIDTEAGTIMNTKDTHTIYRLPSNSVEKINRFISKNSKS